MTVDGTIAEKVYAKPTSGIGDKPIEILRGERKIIQDAMERRQGSPPFNIGNSQDSREFEIGHYAEVLAALWGSIKKANDVPPVLMGILNQIQQTEKIISDLQGMTLEEFLAEAEKKKKK